MEEWSGVPPGERPPNYYAILGLALYELDMEAIRNAAADRMKTFAQKRFKHAELGTQILNRACPCGVCLTDQESKAAYDQRLRVALSPQAADPTASTADTPATAPEGDSNEQAASWMLDEIDRRG